MWRGFVPLLFALCIVFMVGAAFDRNRLQRLDGITFGGPTGGSNTWRVSAVAPGSGAERFGIRPGDVIQYDAWSPAQRALWRSGEVRRIIDLRTGQRVSLVLRPDPGVWTLEKHLGLAAMIVLELAALAILLLRPNLPLARALAASVILGSVGFTAGLAHWTGNATIATVATVVASGPFRGLSVAALGFVALALSRSLGSKRRGIAYATVAFGVLLAVVGFVHWATRLATGYQHAFGLSPAAFIRLDIFGTLLGLVSVASVALGAQGLERRRAVMLAAALLMGNLITIGQGSYTHLATGWEAWLDDAGLLLEATGLAYGVLVDRLIDIGFLFNRAVVVGAVTALVLPAFIGVEWATQKLAESTGRVEGAAVSLVLTIAIALSVRRLHAWVDRAIDSVLFAARHRSANALKRFADEVALFREPSALVTALLDTLLAFTRIDRCAILLADRDDNLVVSDSRALAVPFIAADDVVAVRLKSSRCSVERASFPLLTQADLAFPMVVRGRLIGVLLASLPERAEPLSPEEFDAIAFLMREAGATLVAMDAADAHRLREENLALQARLALPS